MNRKITVGVLFGGQSSEHEVSRVSASSVIRNLDVNKYEVLKIGITKIGTWHIFDGPVEKIENGEWEKEISGLGLSIIDKTREQVDVFFPALHGVYGEDGSVQGLLELMNKPYVGPGILGSALGMDKVFAKIIFDYEGIPQAKYLVLKRKNIKEDMEGFVKGIEDKFGYPCFIKPSNAGSSVGVSKAHNREELVEGLKMASLHDRKVIVEEFVEAREIECAVLGNHDPIASVVGEIIPSREFYDYDSKYNDGTSQIIIPADLDEESSNKIRKYAVRAFKALDCAGMSRVDFFVHKITGQIYINEVNTIPGFTSISMYPKMIEASGISYSELLDRLIELAFEMHREKV